MDKRITKIMIKHKYGESFQLESQLVKFLEKSNYSEDKETIDFLRTAIEKLLVDIDIIAHCENISKKELDEIFSEVYINS